MPANTPDAGFRNNSLPRLKKNRFKFLSSSVAFSARPEAGKKSSPVLRGNKDHVGVLKPRMDSYSEFPSLIHHFVLSGNDREDIYCEMHTRRLLDETLRDWRNSKYLPPIVLAKPTKHKLSIASKPAPESGIPISPGGFKPQTKPMWIPTKLRNAVPLMSSGLLNINPVVLSEKSKQTPVFFEYDEPIIAEEGTDQLKETSVVGKPHLNEKHQGGRKCDGGNTSRLGATEDGVKSTKVRFAMRDSVFVFAKMEM